MKTLFEISADIRELEYKLLELDGELPEGEEGDALEALFDQFHNDRDRKLDNYAAVIFEAEARAVVRKTEAARMTALAKADEKLAERLRARLGQYFAENVPDGAIATNRFTFKLKKPGAAPVVLTNKGQKEAVDLPEAFRRAKFEADKTAIGEVLRSESDDEETVRLKEELAEFAVLGTPKRTVLIR